MNPETTKNALFDRFAELDHVLVHIDATRPEVVVPEHLQGNPALTLKLSHRFQGTMTTDELGVHAWLRFEGKYCECRLPWEAIWGMTSADGERVLFSESIPTEVARQSQSPERRRAMLKRVK